MYVSMTYHSYNIAYGGDKSIDNLDGWVDNWVTLLTAVLKSDVCKVNRALLQSPVSLLHLSAEPGCATPIQCQLASHDSCDPACRTNC